MTTESTAALQVATAVRADLPGWSVTVAAPDGIAVAVLSLLDGLGLPAETLPDIRVQVSDDQSSAEGEAGDDVRWTVALPPAGALPVLLGQIVATATAGLRGHLFLHAGAVAMNDRAWIVVGASGTGKTSTVAALVTQGAEYLTDEVTLIDPGALTVVPFPLPMTIKPWTAQAIATLPRGREMAREGGVHFYRPDRVRSEPALIERIILLEPHRGRAAMTPLSPGDLLLRLAGHPSSLNRPERLAQAFRGFARVVRQARCFVLRAATPAAGAELIMQRLK